MKNQPSEHATVCLRSCLLWARRAQAGLSLVDLIIAAVILAAGGLLLTGALVAFNRSSAVRIEQAVIAQALGSQLSLLDERFSADSPTSGSCQFPFEDFGWDIAQTGANLAPLVELTLTVSKGSNRANVVIYRPFIKP